MPPAHKLQLPSPLKRYRNSLQAVERLPHKSFERAQLLVFAGRREMGKTTALRAYVETAEPRVFALDPFDDFGVIRARYTLEAALEDMRQAGPVRRRVVPPIDDGSRGYAERFFELAIDSLRDCLIVMDEMSLWSGRAESASLRTLILQGRRLGLRMAVACQRLALVPGVVLSEATEMLLFRMSRPRDLDTLEEWTDRETREASRTLEKGECILVEL